jgi:preprotein translocase subunit SecE
MNIEWTGTMLGKAKDFLSEVKVEVKKVIWPSRKEAVGGTMVVMVVVLIIAVFLGIIDTILSKIVEALIAG